MRPEPKYRQIAADLRSRIYAGDLRPGDKLPTETKIGEQYDASRITVRDAVKVLVSEGLVETHRGRHGGVIVRRRVSLVFHASRAEQPNGRRSESDAFFQEAERQGYVASQILTVKRVPAPAHVASRLTVAVGAEVILRRCVRSVDEQPNSIQDTYYPADIARRVKELLGTEDVKQGTTRLMAERGYLQVAFVDDNTARMPTVEEAALLSLGAGTPVYEHARTAYLAVPYAAGKRAVRVSISVFAGDRTTIRYTLGDPAVLEEVGA